MRLMPDELPRHYYAARLDARLASELLGMAKGLICDRIVNREEMDGLRAWLSSHPESQAHFPGREIGRRLMHIYADGKVDSTEQATLLDHLEALTGQSRVSGSIVDRPTRMPFDMPPPALEFTGSHFALTGTFAFGSRRECIELTEALGGTVKRTVTLSVRYVVVGALSSAAWITAAYSRKIERAMALRVVHGVPAIVDEAHWLDCANNSRDS